VHQGYLLALLYCTVSNKFLVVVTNSSAVCSLSVAAGPFFLLNIVIGNFYDFNKAWTAENSA